VLLACLAYLSVALPGSTLGLLWPSMRLSLGEPVGALGILLVSGLGLLTGAAGPLILAPSLLALGLAMAGLYALIRRG
jgi:hypothetical protein